MNKKYRVTLTDDERTLLQDLIASGTAPARTLTHARILLKADQSDDGPAWPDAVISEALEVSGARLRACGNALSRRAWRRPSIAALPVVTASAVWTAPKKPTW